MFPFDTNLVHLEENEYVNASWIKLPKGKNIFSTSASQIISWVIFGLIDNIILMPFKIPVTILRENTSAYPQTRTKTGSIL